MANPTMNINTVSNIPDTQQEPVSQSPAKPSRKKINQKLKKARNLFPALDEGIPLDYNYRLRPKKGWVTKDTPIRKAKSKRIPDNIPHPLTSMRLPPRRSQTVQINSCEPQEGSSSTTLRNKPSTRPAPTLRGPHNVTPAVPPPQFPEKDALDRVTSSNLFRFDPSKVPPPTALKFKDPRNEPIPPIYFGCRSFFLNQPADHAYAHPTKEQLADPAFLHEMAEHYKAKSLAFENEIRRCHWRDTRANEYILNQQRIIRLQEEKEKELRTMHAAASAKVDELGDQLRDFQQKVFGMAVEVRKLQKARSTMADASKLLQDTMSDYRDALKSSGSAATAKEILDRGTEYYAGGDFLQRATADAEEYKAALTGLHEFFEYKMLQGSASFFAERSTALDAKANELFNKPLVGYLEYKFLATGYVRGLTETAKHWRRFRGKEFSDADYYRAWYECESQWKAQYRYALEQAKLQIEREKVKAFHCAWNIQERRHTGGQDHPDAQAIVQAIAAAVAEHASVPEGIHYLTRKDIHFFPHPTIPLPSVQPWPPEIKNGYYGIIWDTYQMKTFPPRQRPQVDIPNIMPYDAADIRVVQLGRINAYGPQVPAFDSVEHPSQPAQPSQ
ncbi:hypothetical protein DM02DRAFT_647728 [Periconia macrospinosa]|uniref:Uncharacterized protein n=1 Tax=Periconia macrospinosa TaxID=97972 RepID=A0A2V1EE47_9PLEO|nr:hypothetical protein DM02DRAFT_647728 [Periconia macrospinosa]